MPRLTEEQRYRIVFLKEQNFSSREIATQIGCNHQSVLNLLGKYEETGSVRDRAGKGRHRTARTAQNIAACRHESRKGFTARSPIKSTRKLAIRLGISRGSVTNIYQKDLQQKSLKCLPVLELSEATKRKRLARCRYLQRRYGYRELERMWFSDESLFPLSGYVNRQNKRLRGRDRASLGNRRIVERAKFPKALMVWAAASKMGKLNLLILPVGTRIPGVLYREMIRNHIVPELERVCGNRRYIFQQDGAPAHRAGETQILCRVLMSDFLQEEFWPPNSPELNPLDYGIWDMMKDRVYATAPKTIGQLEQRIRQVWEELPKKFINSTIDRFRLRLAAVIRNEGGHIQHEFP